ncbi:MAG: outer membrane beta-barrel protein [Ignavibacteria bacterium]|nr:outer membrane beta-barrel protein [Ignavibacteria bacterium]
MKKTALIITLILSFGTLLSQSNQFTITGRVLDSQTKQALVSASVLLTSNKDQSQHYALTDRQGKFSIEKVPQGSYKFKITYIGYEILEKVINVNSKEKTNLGDLLVAQTDILKEAIEVEAQAPLGRQVEDTTEFSASSFKTKPDAVAEDLIKKMPGVEVESDGTVKAQGEEVKKVLVDGKPFFGDDPTLALKNLPAESIEKVQVFDKLSDQAEFTGFDDGESQKTMNIITKQDAKLGSFGKVSVGGGSQERYSASGNVNLFNQKRRFSVLAMSNNVNQQNFSMQDIMGISGSSSQSRFFPPGGMRRPGGGSGGGGRPPSGGGFSPFNFLVGRQSGINTSNAVGLNYSEIFWEKLDLTGSYFFNISKNDNNQFIDRDYSSDEYFGQKYNQQSITHSDNYNHRLNLQARYTIDSNHSIIWKPSMVFQGYDANGSNLAANFIKQDTLSSIDNETASDNNAINLASDLLYRLRLGKQGRTFSINFITNYSNREGTGDLYTLNGSLSENIFSLDTVDQNSTLKSNGYTLGTRMVYTEPIADNGQLQINYNANLQNNYSDKLTYNWNSIFSDYTVLDSILSNRFDNDYLTQRAGIGYNFRNEAMNLDLSLNYQRADLQSDQEFPNLFEKNYAFDNFLPSLRFQYKFSKSLDWRMRYFSSTQAPSITQLQNIIDNTNSLQLSAGNPALKQQANHSINSRLLSLSEDLTRIFMIFVNFTFRSDHITNSTFITQKDTLIADGILLPAGGQITRPENTSGYLAARTFLNYGFPVSFLRSNLNFGVNASFTRNPTLINNKKNSSDGYALGGQIALNSNISDYLDFRIAFRADGNSTKNSLSSATDNNFMTYNADINFNWIFWEDFFISADFNSRVYSGLYVDKNNGFHLLNFGIGKKFLEKNRGEIRLTMYDVLNQNKAVETNLYDYYNEYVRNDIIKQYILLTFTYFLR